MDLKAINDILSGSLAPWLASNQSADKLKVNLQAQKKIELDIPLSFTLEFEAAYTVKAKYYSLIVHNSIQKYIEAFINNFTNSINEDHRAYLVSQALGKDISQKLADTARIISERNYSFSDLNKPEISSLRDDIFILHLIKHSLIWLYQEIKEITEGQIEYDYLDQPAIHATFFQEYVDYPTFIKDIPEPLKKAIEVEKFNKVPQVKFEPKMYDFRGEKKGVLPFEELVLKPDMLQRVEEKLFELGIIDSSYAFIKSKKNSNSKTLALIMLAVIEKGYLRQSIRRKAVTSQQYRKFIEHRYQTDIDRQFRNEQNNKLVIQSFIEDHFWLKNLPKF